MPAVWVYILSLIVAAFLIRASFLVFATRFSMPPALDRFLRYVPAAVLAALVAPGLFKHSGKLDYSLSNPQIYAGMVAILVAWKTRNVLVTLIAGMLALWLIQWLMFRF